MLLVYTFFSYYYQSLKEPSPDLNDVLRDDSMDQSHQLPRLPEPVCLYSTLCKHLGILLTSEIIKGVHWLY